MNDGTLSAPMAQPETVILLEPVDVAKCDNDGYGIDEDRDSVIDGYLFIEESDTCQTGVPRTPAATAAAGALAERAERPVPSFILGPALAAPVEPLPSCSR